MRHLGTRLLTRPRLWLVAAATVAATAIVLLPLGDTIGAQEAAEDPRVIDPTDPCSVPAPPVGFSDRGDVADVHLQSVDCAFAQGITLGTGDNQYAPRSAVRRDQMASFIIRTLQAAGGIDIPSATNQGFADIDGNTHEDAINQLAALGITQGRTATSYAPGEMVRRDQMASFIMRAGGVAFGTTFEALGTGRFTDVAANNVHRANIDAGFEVFGLTVGQTATTYAPDRGVRRDQMASFLIRLLDVTELTDEGTDSSSPLPVGDDLVDDLTDLIENLIGTGSDESAGGDGLIDTVTDLADTVLPLSGEQATSGSTLSQPDGQPETVPEVTTDEARATEEGPATDETGSSTDDDGVEGGGGLLSRLLP